MPPRATPGHKAVDSTGLCPRCTLDVGFTSDNNVTSCRRDRSNTPLQALNLLNDPVFLEAAQAFAVRTLRETPRPTVSHASTLQGQVANLSFVPTTLPSTSREICIYPTVVIGRRRSPWENV